MYVTLTNDFDETFVLDFNDCFLKKELNYDKENHVHFKYMQFDGFWLNMYSDLLIDRIYS